MRFPPQDRETARRFETVFAARGEDRGTSENVLRLLVRGAVAADVGRIVICERDGKPGHSYQLYGCDGSHGIGRSGFSGSMMAGASPIPAIMDRIGEASQGKMPISVQVADLAGDGLQFLVISMRPFGRGEEVTLDFRFAD